MFCATIIPAIGRPAFTCAVQSVLKQDFTAVDFEVIIANDSGKPLLEEKWQKSKRAYVLEKTVKNEA